MNVQETQQQFNYSDLVLNEETHRYTLERDRNAELISVSKFIERFYTPFNSRMISAIKSKKTGTPTNYYSQRWHYQGQEALGRGNRIHLFAEHGVGFDEPIDGFETAVVDFFEYIDTLHQQIVFKELKLYFKKLAGTIDLIVLNDDGTLTLYDYKTNKDLHKKQGKMLGAMKKFDNTPFNKYQIQMSCYKFMIEQTTNLKVRDIILVHISEQGYELQHCEDVMHIITVAAN